VLLAKEEKELQATTDKLLEIGGCYEIVIVEKNKSSENFKTTIPSKNYD
jgi:predicted nuclease of restriction endonuclease-like (RecB) superfamily